MDLQETESYKERVPNTKLQMTNDYAHMYVVLVYAWNKEADSLSQTWNENIIFEIKNCKILGNEMLCCHETHNKPWPLASVFGPWTYLLFLQFTDLDLENERHL